MQNQFKQYFQAVRYLENLACSPRDQAYMKEHNSNPEQFLERTRELSRRLGNPHKEFKFIHISGTSGKGGTVSSLHKILYDSGLSVGSFTSPYASTSIEKIRANEKLIDPKIFAEIVWKIKPVLESMEKNYKWGRASYFEIFFVISLLYFKITKCEWVILEVGCGGTYDAGNIIEKSISATTNIGLDHVKLLGPTLDKIAFQKAGIIKPNSHFFTTEKREKILKIFKKICKGKNAKFHHVKAKKFQNANFDLASAIALHLGIKKEIINKAKTGFSLPCRFEIMQKNPTIVLDGAHNPDKIRSVIANLKNLTYRNLYTIFASSANKDARTMLKLLEKQSKKIILTSFKNNARESFLAKDLAKFLKKGNKSIIENPDKALEKTIKNLSPKDALVITGSFFLAGELRKKWIPEIQILKKRDINP